MDILSGTTRDTLCIFAKSTETTLNSLQRCFCSLRFLFTWTHAHLPGLISVWHNRHTTVVISQITQASRRLCGCIVRLSRWAVASGWELVLTKQSFWLKRLCQFFNMMRKTKIKKPPSTKHETLKQRRILKETCSDAYLLFRKQSWLTGKQKIRFLI